MKASDLMFIRDPYLSPPLMLFQAQFPSSLSLPLLKLLCLKVAKPLVPRFRHSQPIQVSVSATPSLWLVTQPALMTSELHQPPPVTPSLPSLVNQPNQKAHYHRGLLMIYMPERE